MLKKIKSLFSVDTIESLGTYLEDYNLSFDFSKEQSFEVLQSFLHQEVFMDDRSKTVDVTLMEDQDRIPFQKRYDFFVALMEKGAKVALTLCDGRTWEDYEPDYADRLLVDFDPSTISKTKIKEIYQSL